MERRKPPVLTGPSLRSNFFYVPFSVQTAAATVLPTRTNNSLDDRGACFAQTTTQQASESDHYFGHVVVVLQ